jgi:hypothetical protein
MESGSMATDVMALARACPCAHGVEFSGGLGAVVGASGARGWQHSERQAKALPCRARIVVALPSCAMISTATVELACVRVACPFPPPRHLPPPPSGPCWGSPGTAKACTVPSTGPARARPLSHAPGVAKLQITTLPKVPARIIAPHVMTAAHIPIYCALCRDQQ